VQSLALAPASRLAPLWALLPTGALLLVQLLLDVSPRVRERLHAFTGTGENLPGQHVSGGETKAVPGATHSGSRRTRELRVVSWLAWLIALMYLVGFVLSTALFLLPYLLTESELGWGRSVVLTALATAVTYLVFGLVARVPFPPGVLF
jgi:hypothetical protein